MKMPEMILFDAGRTLIDYVSVDTLKGIRAIMPYMRVNPEGYTAEDIDAAVSRMSAHFDACRKLLFEVPERTCLRLVFDLMKLEFMLPLEEIERVLWLETPVIKPLDHVEELLEELHERGIRTAVLSNCEFGGALLKERFDELLPMNRFEFVMSSADYGLRKPSPELFRAAVARSGTRPEDIWYVGDKLAVDVEGSKSCGIIPVLYKNERNVYEDIPDDIVAIDDFLQIITLLNEMS